MEVWVWGGAAVDVCAWRKHGGLVCENGAGLSENECN